MALKLFSLYPESAKTEQLTASIVALLMRYPMGALAKLFDSKNGIHCKHTFMPKAAELTAFLAPIENELYQSVERQRRETQAKLAAPEINRSGRPTLQQMKIKYGKNWGLDYADQIEQEHEAARQEHLRFIERAGKRVFDLECKAAGANQDSLISPSLANLLARSKAES